MLGILLLVACSTAPTDQTPEPIDEDDIVFCAADARECPDGSYVGRVSPSCNFADCPPLQEGLSGQIIDCTDEQKQAEVCTKEYMPVCGYANEAFLTYGNKCEACKSVDYYVQGECA